MCVSAGAPKKPEYGPCRETHGMSYFPATGTQVYYGNSTANDTGTYTAADWGTTAGISTTAWLYLRSS